MKGNGNTERHRHAKHCAKMLLAQLPEDPEVGLLTLEYVKDFYVHFMDDSKPNLQIYSGLAKEA